MFASRNTGEYTFMTSMCEFVHGHSFAGSMYSSVLGVAFNSPQIYL